MQSTEDIWCSLLETKIKSSGQANVETAAFGQGGWQAKDLSDWAIGNLMQFDPDIVIVMIGGNDLTFAREYRSRPPPSGWRALWTRCKEYLQICRMAAAAVEGLRGPVQDTDQPARVAGVNVNLRKRREIYARLPYVAAAIRQPDPIEVFADGMQRLLAFLRRAHVEVIVLGNPALWRKDLTAEEMKSLWIPVRSGKRRVRVDPGWLAAEMRRYNALQEEIARAHGASYVDLGRIIPQDLNHFMDDSHFTDQGNKAVAAAVLPTLKDALAKIRH
jgi:lysophospholipase L1-like esterase